MSNNPNICPRCDNYVPGQATGASDICDCPPVYAVNTQEFKRELVEHYDFLEKNSTPAERAAFAQAIYGLGIQFNYAEQARRQGYDHETAKKNNGL